MVNSDRGSCGRATALHCRAGDVSTAPYHSFISLNCQRYNYLASVRLLNWFICSVLLISARRVIFLFSSVFFLRRRRCLTGCRALSPPSPSSPVASLSSLHNASSSPLLAEVNARALQERMQREQARQAGIEENLETALQCYPEQFAPIAMLYIPCEINGIKMRAFVDSGAQVHHPALTVCILLTGTQSTILSLRTAQRCGLTHLIDQRFQGVAKGVGSARILGKVHLAPIKIGGVFLPSSFTILDSPVRLRYTLYSVRCAVPCACLHACPV